MKRIGILSDTHGSVPRQVYTFFKDCDELWHAGDLGRGVLETLQAFKPTRAVWGNIDDSKLHLQLPRINNFTCDGLHVIITHIGGYPDHYDRQIQPLLLAEKPDIFISGHSHILRVMFDRRLNLLHINPGAAGHQGFHKVSTLVRFTIDGTPKDLEILDFPKFDNPTLEV